VLVILDTGAPGVVLNQKYYTPDNAAPIMCKGINGSYDCTSRRIRQWSWLGITHKNTDAILSDLQFLEKALNTEIYALIGLPLLMDYYVTIDYDRNEIMIAKEMKTFPVSSFSRFQYVDHVPVMTCRINGEKKILGLDTGSEENHLFGLQTVHDEILEEASPVYVTGTENISTLRHQLSMDLEVIHLQEIYSSAFIVDFNEEGVFQDEILEGLLGQCFLSQFNIIIHPGRQRILFSPRKQATTMLVASP
jgi:hypothetical protein